MMRFERRFDTPLSVRLSVSLVSLLAALALTALFLALIGISPKEALTEMWVAAFVDSYGLSETLTKAIPLALCATGLALSYKMVIWNIGAQGQVLMGALATVAVVRYAPTLPIGAMLPALLLAGAVAGGLWAAISAFLKVKWKVNEIISTLMLNYIALNLKDYLTFGPWRDPSSLGFPMTKAFPAAARLPLIGFGRVHAGIYLALLLAFFFAWMLKRSKVGYELRVVGENPRAAHFAGINAPRLTIKVLFLSGMLCGLAGAVTMTGLEWRLQGGFNAAFGNTAIIVAWLGGLSPIAGLLVSVLMGGLLVGGESLQVMMNLPSAGVQIIQGFILMFLVAGQFFILYRPVRKGARE